MVLTETGLAKVLQRIKSFIASQIGTKANASDLNNYLRLSGGTLSGNIAFNGTCYTTVGTGKELSSERYVVTTTHGSNLGGSLYLYGGDHENPWGEKGNFRLVAQSKEKGSKYLLGTPSGSLTWNSKELATQEYVNTNLGTKANDSDAVHKTGNETIGGVKTFTDLQITSYGTQYKGNKNAYILPEFTAGYSGLAITTLGFSQTLKIGNFVLDSNNKPVLDTSKAYIQVATGEINNVNTCLIEPRNSTSSLLGTSTNKWKTINGVEPSDLSLPSNTSINIDTTGFTWGRNFTFTPSVNGYLFISIGASTGIRKLSLKTGRGEYYFSNQTEILRFTLPVYKDKIVTILAASTVTETVVPGMELFPLQGNV